MSPHCGSSTVVFTLGPNISNELKCRNSSGRSCAHNLCSDTTERLLSLMSCIVHLLKVLTFAEDQNMFAFNHQQHCNGAGCRCSICWRRIRTPRTLCQLCARCPVTLVARGLGLGLGSGSGLGFELELLELGLALVSGSGHLVTRVAAQTLTSHPVLCSQQYLAQHGLPPS